MHGFTWTYRSLIVATGCLLPVSSALADEFIPFGEETFEIRAGVFLQNFDTIIEVIDTVEDIGGRRLAPQEAGARTR